MKRFLAVWSVALPGFAAFLVGVGLSRFAYTPMLPVMIEGGWLSPPQAAYVGAGNLFGALLGAFFAQAVGARIGVVRTLRAALLISVIGAIACALPWGFWWIGGWRIVLGAATTTLATLAAPLVVAAAPPSLRGSVSGAVFTGVGLGMALTGALVPQLAGYGAAASWLGIALVTAIAAAIAWRGWPQASASVPPSNRARPAAQPARLAPGLASASFLLLLAGYAADGLGFVPHSLFWADYVARELGRGVDAGGLQWTLFGVGAAIGPVLCGRLCDAIGFGPALLVGFAIKAGAVLLAVIAPSMLGLTLSSLIVGALTPGLAAILSGVVLERLGADAHAPGWRLLMITFTVASAAGGYLCSALYSMTHSYALLFTLGGATLALGCVLSAAGVVRLPRGESVGARI